MEIPSTELLERYRTGDEPAADELFRRYLGRLTVLARARLSARIARRIDPEDVVMSAYRSFFLRARDGRLDLARSGDLWRLLVAITLNKLHRAVAHHQAARRSVRREQATELDDSDIPLDRRLPPASPTAEEAVALAELLESFLAELSPLNRTILELRLQDGRVPEIAGATNRSERTIRRVLDQLEHRLRQRLNEPNDR